MLNFKNAFVLRNVLRTVPVGFIIILFAIHFVNFFLSCLIHWNPIFLVMFQIRRWSTFPVHLDDKINHELESEQYKPKEHPGKTRLQPIEIPERIRKAIRTAVDGIFKWFSFSLWSTELHIILNTKKKKIWHHRLEHINNDSVLDEEIPNLIDEGSKLDRHLLSRKIPLEQKDVYLAKKDIERDILRREGVRHVSELSMYSIRFDSIQMRLISNALWIASFSSSSNRSRQWCSC